MELQSYLAANGRILRQGEILDVIIPSANSINAVTRRDTQLQNGHRHKINGHTETISFQVTLTEPVLQGYISETDCEIIVLPPISKTSDKTTGSNRLKPTSSSSLQATNGGGSSNSRSKEEEDWHVDEDFLAAGMNSSFESSSHLLPPLHHLNTSAEGASASGNGTATSSTWQSPLSTPLSLPSAQLEASLSESSNTRLLNNKGRLVRVTACNTYIDEEDLTPSIRGQGEGKDDERPSSEDEHLRAYVKASDLSKLGLFSGDRIEIVALGNEGSKRIVRVYGLRNPPSTPDK